jgi:ABC-2 type transport system permease protein
MTRTIRESSILFGRNVKKVIRTPMMIFFSLFQPLLWLVLFTEIFERFGQLPIFRGQGYESYLMFFAPTVLTMTVLTSAFQSGMGMVTDVETGMLDKFMINPIRRSSILVGKVFADATRMLLQGAMVLGVALLLGARIETGLLGALVMMTIAAAFGIAWAGLSNIVALRTRNGEMTMMIGILLTFPLLFLSTGLMPEELLPGWLEVVGRFNPVTYVIETGREFMNFGYDWAKVAQTLGIIAVVGALTFTGATRAFRRATT